MEALHLMSMPVLALFFPPQPDAATTAVAAVADPCLFFFFTEVHSVETA